MDEDQVEKKELSDEVAEGGAGNQGLTLVHISAQPEIPLSEDLCH